VADVQTQVDTGRLQKTSVIRRRVKNKLKRHKVHALFDVKFDTRQRHIILEPRENELAKRTLLDGKFVLQTTEVTWSSEKALTTYRNHDEAEKVIQRLKQLVPVRPIRHWNDQRVTAHLFLSILACLVLAVLRHLARQIGLTVGVKNLREWLQRVKQVVSHVSVGELVIPYVTLTGLTDKVCRLLQHIGVPLPEPAETAWIALRLEAADLVEATLALV
jgi:transposase